MDHEIPSLLDCNLVEISKGLNNGTFTSAQLVEAYQSRIAEVNDEFRAVIELNPNALEHAHMMDINRKVLGSRGLLHGVPILLKDNVVTLGAMDATSGSMALVGTKPKNESAVVSALWSAGAIPLGKANMAEWCGFRSTSGCTGWSARGGQARGIFYPDMTPSGSSTGSAISTALGLCFASIGTETVFSVVSPAEKSGVVGFKPTRGLISSEGLIFSSHNQDTVGLLTRTVKDAADILVEIIKRPDPGPLTDYRNDLREALGTSPFLEDLTGIRIGIPTHMQKDMPSHGHKAFMFTAAVESLKRAGAIIATDDVNILGADEFNSLSQTHKEIIQVMDMKIATNTYFSGLKENPKNLHNLHDIIEWIKNCEAEEFPQRNVEMLQRAEDAEQESEVYKEMLGKETYYAGDGGIPGVIDRHNLHVLLMPQRSITMQTFAGKAGSPVMSLPIGCYPEGTAVQKDTNNGFVLVAPGIPFSIYIFGKPQADHNVLKVGYVLEQLTETRKELKPYKLPVKDLAYFVDPLKLDAPQC